MVLKAKLLLLLAVLGVLLALLAIITGHTSELLATGVGFVLGGAAATFVNTGLLSLFGLLAQGRRKVDSNRPR